MFDPLFSMSHHELPRKNDQSRNIGIHFNWIHQPLANLRGKKWNIQQVTSIESVDFQLVLGGLSMTYPLVNQHSNGIDGHRNSGFSHEKWVDLSIAMLVHQRVHEKNGK